MQKNDRTERAERKKHLKQLTGKSVWLKDVKSLLKVVGEHEVSLVRFETWRTIHSIYGKQLVKCIKWLSPEKSRLCEHQMALLDERVLAHLFNLRLKT